MCPLYIRSIVRIAEVTYSKVCYISKTKDIWQGYCTIENAKHNYRCNGHITTKGNCFTCLILFPHFVVDISKIGCYGGLFF